MKNSSWYVNIAVAAVFLAFAILALANDLPEVASVLAIVGILFGLASIFNLLKR